MYFDETFSNPHSCSSACYLVCFCLLYLAVLAEAYDRGYFTVIICSFILSFPLFSPRKKWSKKVQGCPDRSAQAAKPTHNGHSALSAARNYFQPYCASSYKSLTFSKAHCNSELKCNKLQALYPALLFLSIIMQGDHAR
jgi:hypothetical protein